VNTNEQYTKEQLEKVLRELKEQPGDELVLIRRKLRSGEVTYQPLTRVLAKILLFSVHFTEPNTERAKIISLTNPEVYKARGKVRAPKSFYAVPERVERGLGFDREILH